MASRITTQNGRRPRADRRTATVTAIVALALLGAGAQSAWASTPQPKEKESVASQTMPQTIVGGGIAPAGAYPFFTALKFVSTNAHFCGGTLVSTMWVLTSAHCVYSVSVAGVKLVIGANRLSPETGGEVRSVSQIHVHPSFNPSTHDNDVALLRLNTASTKRWARLAEPSEVNTGTVARAIGHGHTTQGGVASNDLRQVDLSVQSDATMNASAYGASFHGAVMIGAGPLAGGQGFCNSDHGGPLFLAPGSQARLIGDTSWGSGCAQANAPGIFGEVYQGMLRSFVNNLIIRPSNDNAGGSQISGAAGTASGSNTDATGEVGEPIVTGNSADTSVWYSWTAPENGPTSFHLRDAAFDTTLGVYTGDSFAGLAVVASNDDFNGSPRSKVTFNATAGTQYRIQVGGFNAQHGSFVLQWAQNSPANDTFAGATALTGTYYGTKSGTTVRSTGEPGEPYWHGGAIADNSVWYTWTPAHSAPSKLRLRNVAGGLNPWMAVYTGSAITGLTEVANGSAEVSFNTVAGTTYRIAVDGSTGTTGTFTLEYVIGKCNGANATLFANGGTTTGTAGDDVIVGSTVSETINGAGGNDTICAFSGNDTMSGDAGNDKLFGSLGNDWFKEGSASNGADRMAGEAGIDYVFYNARTTTGVNVTIDATANDGQAGEGDYVTDTNEVIYGSTKNDIMQGAIGNEELRGGAGNDTLRGGAGYDAIVGGPGNDILRGEADDDALDLVDGVGGNDNGDGGTGTDSAVQDAGDTVTNVP